MVFIGDGQSYVRSGDCHCLVVALHGTSATSPVVEHEYGGFEVQTDVTIIAVCVARFFDEPRHAAVQR